MQLFSIDSRGTLKEIKGKLVSSRLIKFNQALLVI